MGDGEPVPCHLLGPLCAHQLCLTHYNKLVGPCPPWGEIIIYFYGRGRSVHAGSDHVPRQARPETS